MKKIQPKHFYPIHQKPDSWSFEFPIWFCPQTSSKKFLSEKFQYFLTKNHIFLTKLHIFLRNDTEKAQSKSHISNISISNSTKYFERFRSRPKGKTYRFPVEIIRNGTFFFEKTLTHETFEDRKFFAKSISWLEMLLETEKGVVWHENFREI